MNLRSSPPPLPWLEPSDPFPAISRTWGVRTPAPGLLCAGADLTVARLERAYRQGIFPWFSAGQPILWWSPDPRMLLQVEAFQLHRSLRKTLTRFIRDPDCEIRVDAGFGAVIEHCAHTPRPGQGGTWIVDDMVQAYVDFHRAGFAHSVETWQHGKLVGGLYFVNIGKAVFGESMFHHVSDASKIALAALVALCRHHGVAMIDCQQNTRHLASLGAKEVSRDEFVAQLASATQMTAPNWNFEPVYWQRIDLNCPGKP